MGEQIRVIVEKDGRVKLKVEGVGGSQCLTITESIEKSLGEVFERHKTREFYKTEHMTLRNSVLSQNRIS